MSPRRRSTEPYAQIVASLPWHRKVCECIDVKDAPAAFGLHVAAICFCQEKRTDGRILRSQLPAVLPMTDKDRARLSAVLVKAELWHDDGAGGFLIHDYLEHNKSRAEIEDLSQTRAGAGSKGGSKRGSKRDDFANQVAVPASNAASATATDAATCFESNPDSKISPCRSVPVDNSVPEQVSGYFSDKVGHEPTMPELLSLKSLCRNFPADVVTLAIGQAVTQGSQANDFGLITTIARAEVS